MNLSMRDLECFLAFARTGHVSRAAELCEATQPTVSKALARVEREFGIPLFDRTRRSLRLTRAGRALEGAVGEIRSNFEAARQLASSLRAENEGVLRIGATGGVRNSLLAGTLSLLVRRRPALRVVLTVDLSDALVAGVLLNSLDLAVVPDYGRFGGDVLLDPIGTDTLVPAARLGHPLAQRRVVRVKDLVEFPWILSMPGSAARQAFETAFSARQLALPRAAMEVEYMSDVALGVLERSDLLALVPASTLRARARGALTQLGVGALRIPRRLVLVTRRGQTQPPLTRDFLEIAVAQWREQALE